MRNPKNQPFSSPFSLSIEPHARFAISCFRVLRPTQVPSDQVHEPCTEELVGPLAGMTHRTQIRVLSNTVKDSASYLYRTPPLLHGYRSPVLCRYFRSH